MLSLEGGPMRYVRIFADDRGRSAFEEVELASGPPDAVLGRPPFVLSAPFPANRIVFVFSGQPVDDFEWGAHPVPTRQWVFVLRGTLSVTVSSGEERRFHPGDVLFAEDTDGEGHVTVPLPGDVAFAMIPVSA
jgi:hypothetical protein